MSTAELLGPLRGAAPPAETLLEAIREISPAFRVSFTPEIVRDGHTTRPAMWWIHEVRPFSPHDGLLRAAGKARLGRLAGRPRVELERRIGDWWDAEYAAIGFYQVGYYYSPRVTHVNHVRVHPTELFGTQPMLEQLRRAQAMLADEQRRVQIENQREAGADAAIEEEVHDNPEFASFVRDVAFDFYRAVSGGELVSVNGFKGAQYDEPDRESVGEPGHAGSGQPGQHPDGSAGEPTEGEVRASGNGRG